MGSRVFWTNLSASHFAVYAVLGLLFFSPKVAANPPAVPESVNFITGIPLVGLGDTTGGFGDVAANILNALEFKKRHPGSTVNVVVTSYGERPYPQVMTTNEILKIMAPGLKPALGAKAQDYQGLHFIFLKEDAKKIFEGPQNDLPTLRASLRAQIPAVDLSIQFSANNSPMEEALKANAKFSFSLHELGGSPQLVQDQINHEYVKLNAGASSMGMYLEKATDESAPEAERQEIAVWMKTNFQQELKPESKVLFAYSKDQGATQLYIDAVKLVAKKNPNLSYILAAKDFPNLDLSALPPNLQVVKSRAFPNQVIRALIKESALSPLVTGDSSLSLAITHATDAKSFIYEAPPWKQQSAAALVRELVGQGVDKASIRSLVLTEIPYYPITEGMHRLWHTLKSNTTPYTPLPSRYSQGVEALAKTLVDGRLQKSIHQALEKVMPVLDIQDNLLRVYAFYRLFQKEFAEKTLPADFAEFSAETLKRAPDEKALLDLLKKNLGNPRLSGKERSYSAALSLRLNKDLSSAEILSHKNALSAREKRWLPEANAKSLADCPALFSFLRPSSVE